MKKYRQFRFGRDDQMVLRPPLIRLAATMAGFTALVYEIIAAKVLFYFFQDNTYSTAAVVAVFLFGLALGSFLFGQVYGRLR
jgi:spermidine synthase